MSFKYRLAFVASGKCVIRYDNAAGKGDHRHIGESEKAYRFIDLDQLMADFERDIARWQRATACRHGMNPARRSAEHPCASRP
jgi:hypothetical protein